MFTVQTAWHEIIGPEEVTKYKDVTSPTIVHYPKGGSPDILSQIVNDKEKLETTKRIFRNLCARTIYTFQYEDSDDEEGSYQPTTTGISDWYIASAISVVNHLFVIYDGPGPKIAAFALLNTQNQPTPTTSYLSLICSSGVAKGKGYGGMLIKAAEDIARKEKKTSIMLGASGSVAAYYRDKFGFKYTGTHTDAGYIMKKPLTYATAVTGATRRRRRYSTRRHRRISSKI